MTCWDDDDYDSMLWLRFGRSRDGAWNLRFKPGHEGYRTARGLGGYRECIGSPTSPRTRPQICARLLTQGGGGAEGGGGADGVWVRAFGKGDALVREHRHGVAAADRGLLRDAAPRLSGGEWASRALMRWSSAAPTRSRHNGIPM